MPRTTSRWTPVVLCRVNEPVSPADGYSLDPRPLIASTCGGSFPARTSAATCAWIVRSLVSEDGGGAGGVTRRESEWATSTAKKKGAERGRESVPNLL